MYITSEDIVVNDKKRRLSNFEKLWKLPQKNPGRILSFKTPQVKSILKTSYSILLQKSVQWNHETKVYLHGHNTESK